MFNNGTELNTIVAAGITHNHIHAAQFSCKRIKDLRRELVGRKGFTNLNRTPLFATKTDVASTRGQGA